MQQAQTTAKPLLQVSDDGHHHRTKIPDITTPPQAEERLTSFADTWRFPEFEKPDLDQDVAGTPFYDEPGDRWCLLAEITDVSPMLRVRLVVRDREGESLVIAFYPDNDATEVLDTSKLKVGHTIALLYPHQHYFLDRTQGVRVEDVSTYRVFPVKLAELFRINSDLCAYLGPLGTLKKCHSCGKEDPSVVKCGRCGLYYYCNKVSVHVFFLRKSPGLTPSDTGLPDARMESKGAQGGLSCAQRPKLESSVQGLPLVKASTGSNFRDE
ncbi:unnamed protein product [Colletotrichum noveboracense]|uniref:Uncharacterized protein n=1 Tax=Colletotrichum noveboracense TaxID=2664923 RepID=A0A9W4RUK4_9PEZI|nr:unnamed protein product [Colletotrichum noveboracense]